MRIILSELKLWIVSMRFYAHSASILPVTLGTAYAWLATGAFFWGRFAVAVLAGIFYQSGCNLINDYYDFKHGLDRPDTFGGSGVLWKGEMSPRKMAAGIVALLSLGTLLGLGLVVVSGWVVLWLGVFGLFGAIFYTAPPCSAKYNALGDPLVFAEMGVAMTLGGYAVQTGTLAWGAVWIGIPLSLLVTAILHANNLRDLADDRQSGIRTAATLLGPKAARIYYDILLFSPYFALFALVQTRVAPWTILTALVILPLPIRIHRQIWRHRGEKSPALKNAPQEAAMLHLAFNALLCAGVVAGRWIL